MGWVVNATPATLLPGMTRYLRIGGWVSTMAGKDGCGKSLFYWDSITVSSSSQRIAVPAELSRSITK